MDSLPFYELLQDSRNYNTVNEDGPICYPSHFHKKVELTYVKRGTVTSRVAGQEFTVREGEILFVPEYYPHSYDCSEDARRIIVLPPSLYYTDVSNVMQKRTFKRVLTNKKFNEEKILPILNAMLAAQNDNPDAPEYAFLMVKGFVNALFGQLAIGYADSIVSESKEMGLIVDILNYIDENYAEDITLDSIADKFNYNKFYFSKLFNAHLGENLNNYVNSVRVRKIAKLMANTELGTENVTSLAFKNGFNSMPSFYRTFQKVFHCTPTEYFKMK